jgi:hypothetical protein
VLVLAPTPGLICGGESYYPGNRVPTIPEAGPFILEGFAGPNTTFDPWPSGGWQATGHPGLVGWEWGGIADGEMPRGRRWSVIAADRDRLAFDHRRARGKCRFGRGEVLFTGTFEVALATVLAVAPPPDFAAASMLEVAEARWRAVEEEFWMSLARKCGTPGPADGLSARTQRASRA